MKLRHSSVLSVPAALLALAACASKPPVIIESTMNSDPALVSQSPNEIVVLPVEDATNSRGIDTTAMRAAIADALPEKRYVPIRLSHADSVLANAGVSLAGSAVDAAAVQSLRGKLDEDALLGVRITRWDTSRLAATGRLQFTAETMLTSSATGQPLWWGVVEGDVKAGGETGVVPVSTDDKLKSVHGLFGRYILAELPRRIP